MSARIRSASEVSYRAYAYLSEVRAWQAGNTGAKKRMATHARVILTRLAELADLPSWRPCTTRYNAGGPAVSGEVYLSASGLHAWIEVSCVLGPVLTMRSRSGISPITDGRNHVVTLTTLEESHAACLETSRSMATIANEGRKA